MLRTTDYLALFFHRKRGPFFKVTGDPSICVRKVGGGRLMARHRRLRDPSFQLELGYNSYIVKYCTIIILTWTSKIATFIYKLGMAGSEGNCSASKIQEFFSMYTIIQRQAWHLITFQLWIADFEGDAEIGRIQYFNMRYLSTLVKMMGWLAFGHVPLTRHGIFLYFQPFRPVFI